MKRRHLAALALFLAAAAWGATFTVIKNVLSQIAPEPFIFYRFTLAGVLLLAFAIGRGTIRRAVFVPALTLGALVFAGYWLQTRALLVISPSRSAFLTGVYVVIVPFCDRLMYGVDVPARAWIGAVLAASGTTVMVGPSDQRPSWGDALTLGCAIVFAFHVVLSARYTARFPATSLAAIQVLFVGILAAPFTYFAPRPIMSRSLVLVILFTAIVTTALAFAALMWGQAHVSATQAAVILAFEPVAASITSVLWDHEPITMSFIAGGVLILMAMIVSQASATMPADGPNPRHE